MRRFFNQHSIKNNTLWQSMTSKSFNLCPSQCWASTSARQLQAPTSPYLWKAGEACWTGSGPLRRRSQCLVMLCPLSRLVRWHRHNVLNQPMCTMNMNVSLSRHFLSRWKRCVCDWHCPLQKPCFYYVLPEVIKSLCIYTITGLPWNIFYRHKMAPLHLYSHFHLDFYCTALQILLIQPYT